MPSLPAKPILSVGSNNNIGRINIKDKVYYSPAYPKKGYLKPIAEIWEYTLPNNGMYFEEEIFNYTISVKYNGNPFYNKDFSSSIRNEIIIAINDSPYIEIEDNGQYQISYSIFYKYLYTTDVVPSYADFTLTYDLYITENTEPLKKWNAWTVCERLLKIAEPLRENETPRFKIKEEQKSWHTTKKPKIFFKNT